MCNDTTILEFHREKCCQFKEETRQGLKHILKKIMDYENLPWETNDEQYSLWQCPHCGAYFLLMEDELTVWSEDGDWDIVWDYFYQVDSPEHAEKLISEKGLLKKYEGPSTRW